MYFGHHITELTVDEYAFLTENFEISDKSDIKNGVRYLVYNRKRSILNTVKKVIENELSSLEKELVLDFWGKELTIAELENKYKISRAGVYRYLNNAKKKIEKFIKYVLVYDEEVQHYSASDFLKFIKEDYVEN